MRLVAGGSGGDYNEQLSGVVLAVRFPPPHHHRYCHLNRYLRGRVEESWVSSTRDLGGNHAMGHYFRGEPAPMCRLLRHRLLH